MCSAFTRKGKDRKSTRLNSSHVESSYAVFCLNKKTNLAPVRHGHQPLADRFIGPAPTERGGRGDPEDDRRAQPGEAEEERAVLCFYCYAHHRDLHPFPPRRSSD